VPGKQHRGELPSLDYRLDPEIVRDAVKTIRYWVPLAYEQVKVLAHNGWVTLEDEVEWDFHGPRAERAVRRVRGV
jgi:osmotically-inducible protein OsmY